MDPAALSRFGRRVYVPLPDADSRRSIFDIHLSKKGHRLDFPMEMLIEATDDFSGRQLSNLASAVVEHMVSDCNCDLAEVAARGDASVERYQIKTRPLRLEDVEPVLSQMQPETPPDLIRRFESWK
jgi:vacuolar protein-sorting-associated protein 4